MLELTREAMILICLGALFVISGAYFGIVRGQVGLQRLAPLQGDIGRIWGVIMVFTGAFLWFVALT